MSIFYIILSGADTPLYAALLPEGVSAPKGKFLSDRKAQDY